MGLDIYAGTLTRYYSRTWKTVAQQFAEANGIEFQTMYIEEQGDIPTPESIQDDMQDFANQIAEALDDGQTAWQESLDIGYYTDKPDWQAFGALILHTASIYYKVEAPKTIMSDEDIFEQELVARALNDEEVNMPLLNDCEWWLPFKGDDGFMCNLPDNREMHVSTIDVLVRMLDKINERSWQADEETILSWSKTEGYSGEPIDITDENLEIADKVETHSIDSLAKFAFSIFYQGAKFAKENNVPLLLDY